MEMVYIPAGSFLMGSPADMTRSQQETERGWVARFEKPHQVTLTKGFYMARHEVTQAQWEKVMGYNPSLFKNAGPNAPVDSVSWHDCQTFATNAGGGLRLPTEAEWEYIARAGSTSSYPWGDSCNGTEANVDGTNPHGTSTKGPNKQVTTTVGSYSPNAWGLYDTVGNTWEWCSDWYDGGYYAVSPATDPPGPNSGSSRVLRGGSWRSLAINARSSSRVLAPGSRYDGIGFRVVAE